MDGSLSSFRMKGASEMENITLKIGDRTVPLRFTMREFIQIEEQVGNLGEVKELLMKGKNRLRNLVRVILIMGNAGLREAGDNDELTEEWLLDHMDPHALMAYQIGVIACLTKEGESQAVQEDNENNERDLVLEEIEAKKDPVNSPSGE